MTTQVSLKTTDPAKEKLGALAFFLHEGDKTPKAIDART